MNAELPHFRNGEHNSESASTIDHVKICLKVGWQGKFFGLSESANPNLPKSNDRTMGTVGVYLNPY